MIPLPGMGAGLPSMSGGTAASGATTSGSIQTPITSPFVFDHSNWTVQSHSNGDVSPRSSSGGQTAPGLSGSGGSGGTGGMGGINPLMLIAAAAMFFLF